jgi:hypothetical protein
MNVIRPRIDKLEIENKFTEPIENQELDYSEEDRRKMKKMHALVHIRK